MFIEKPKDIEKWIIKDKDGYWKDIKPGAPLEIVNIFKLITRKDKHE